MGENDGSFFTADNRPIIAIASARTSKTVSTSGSDLLNLVRGLVDELETSQVARARIKVGLGGKRSLFWRLRCKRRMP